MIKLTCPNNKKHKTFHVTAHEVHDWEVNDEGMFLKDLGCSEMAHRPDCEDHYTCAKCGAEAINPDRRR